MNDKLVAVRGGKPAHKGRWPDWPVWNLDDEVAILEAIRGDRESGGETRWGRGKQAERFEERFAAVQGARYGLCVTSGTIALQIALLALGIGAGDEVLVPAYSFLASGTAVVAANATPVFVDVDPQTLTMDPAAAEAAVTSRTKVIMPVHIAGLPADLDRIGSLARRFGLVVLEDACQAHGAMYHGQGVGSHGAMGCFSFQASKNLNCGEGGFITTNDAALMERARAIHNCGRGMDDEPVMSGNHRITEFQAAILNTQLDRLESQMRTREANAGRLTDLLKTHPGVAPQQWTPGTTRHAYHLFSFRLNEEAWGVPRAAVIRALAAEGIPATEGYTTPLHRLPLFATRAFGPFSGCREAPIQPACPVADRLCGGEGAWIYQKYLLASRRDRDAIFDAFWKLWEQVEELRDWWRTQA